MALSWKEFTGTPTRLVSTLVAVIIGALAVLGIVLIIILKANHVDKGYRGAVVTNGPECAAIARNIMKTGGTVADAAIAGLFCEGVTMSQSMGLGGGFLMTFYNRTTGKAISLNSREVAPKAATEDMFGGNSSLSLKGGLSVAVPAELRGYWELYKTFGGGVPWKDLVQPSINLCFMGIKVKSYFANVLKSAKASILAEPLLSEIFIDPETNDVWIEGDVYKRTRLGKTLIIIAKEGGEALHNGSLTARFVKDIQDRQGIVTLDDMKAYRPKWQEPISTILSGGQTVYTQPLPGSGAVLTLILNILDNFLDLKDPDSVDNYQKIIESFKFGYAERTFLGDENFVDVNDILSEITSPQFAESLRDKINLTATFDNPSYYGANTTSKADHGTANLCFLAPNGDAITVTSTINTIFGAGFVSRSTGIILNDQMDDFSSKNITNVYDIPPSPANFIKPGKRPLSSMSPTIVVNKDGVVELLVGAAGGSKIITTVAEIMIRHLLYGENLKAASNNKRFHHQLWPMVAEFESAFQTEDEYIVEGLKKIGHNVSFADGGGFASATCISTRGGRFLLGVYDKRRPGSVSYL